jgi:hypothetical protein
MPNKSLGIVEMGTDTVAEITKMLGIAINNFDEGRLSHGQLLSILQEAIDNGDILVPDNELYAVAVVIPFIDRGVLKIFQTLGSV